MSDSDDDRNAKEADQFMEPEPPKRKKKAKRRANRAALEQKRQEIEMETFKEFASTVTADYLAEMCRLGISFFFVYFLCCHVTIFSLFFKYFCKRTVLFECMLSLTYFIGYKFSVKDPGLMMTILNQ